jgi:hypothetical protein
MRRRESARRFFAGQAATRVPARRVGRCRGFLAARRSAKPPPRRGYTWKHSARERPWHIGFRRRAPIATGRMPVSDPRTFGGVSQYLSQFPFRARPLTRKLLILNGEMSEWLKEHAWKAKSASDTEQLQSTLSRSTFAT